MLLQIMAVLGFGDTTEDFEKGISEVIATGDGLLRVLFIGLVLLLSC